MAASHTETDSSTETQIESTGASLSYRVSRFVRIFADASRSATRPLEAAATTVKNIRAGLAVVF